MLEPFENASSHLHGVSTPAALAAAAGALLASGSGSSVAPYPAGRRRDALSLPLRTAAARRRLRRLIALGRLASSVRRERAALAALDGNALAALGITPEAARWESGRAWFDLPRERVSGLVFDDP